MTSTGYCRDCFTGTLHGDAVLTGHVERIHGLPTYVAGPEAGAKPKALIVIIPDAFGWELQNTRALADSYARRGEFLVYLPDFMDGAAPPQSVLADIDGVMGPSPDWYTTLVMKPYWALKTVAVMVPFLFWTRRSVAKPRVVRFFQDLRASPPPFQTSNLKIGVAGFCWGGYYTIFLAQDNPETRVASPGSAAGVPLIDCGFTGHPSSVSIPSDILAVRLPLSVANGPDDALMGREKMVQLTKILEDNEDAAHEIVVYESARHGFANRGDPNDPKQAEIGLRAEDQAVNWFSKNLC
ncbi:dienelactone hydrolase [Apiospora rasikravindrae]|uniref:Dienelactone hydrolase n=1 Tax=Apiospora rasikravindrae TaxID=990691 RepID=A0ABR1T6J7_9PEZI